MNFAIILVIIILVIAVVSTLLLAGKSDEGYRNNTKKNTVNLTVIYTLTTVLSAIAVGVYIWWFV